MEELEDTVCKNIRLLNTESLTEACRLLEIDIPERKQGNKESLIKLVLRYLYSEEVEQLADEGLLAFVTLSGLITKHFPNINTKPYESKSGSSSDITTRLNSSNPFSSDFNSTESKFLTDFTKINPVESLFKEPLESKLPSEPKLPFNIHKLKEFKISGSIGNVGQKDKLSYSSLLYQIQNGKSAGYTGQEICYAVIKSITPENYLRTYLETRGDLNLESLLKILRSHFKEKDSTSRFTEMSTSVQTSIESPLEFTVRLMSLRQKVILLSREEDCPYNPKLIQKRFLHALSTGLRNDNLRNELRDCFDQIDISDEYLLSRITKAVSHESEHLEKLHFKKKDYDLLSMEMQPKDNHLLKEMKELRLSHDKEISSLRCDISELKTAFNNNKHSFVPKRPSRQRNMCPNCTVSNSRCNHCFCCGSRDHFRPECPFQRSDEKNE